MYAEIQQFIGRINCEGASYFCDATGATVTLKHRLRWYADLPSNQEIDSIQNLDRAITPILGSFRRSHETAMRNRDMRVSLVKLYSRCKQSRFWRSFGQLTGERLDIHDILPIHHTLQSQDLVHTKFQSCWSHFFGM